MKQVSDACDSFIVDTCRTSGKFVAGAITFKGRKKLDVLNWNQAGFNTQEEADRFVRNYFAKLGIAEVTSEDELAARYPRW